MCLAWIKRSYYSRILINKSGRTNFFNVIFWTVVRCSEKQKLNQSLLISCLVKLNCFIMWRSLTRRYYLSMPFQLLYYLLAISVKKFSKSLKILFWCLKTKINYIQNNIQTDSCIPAIASWTASSAPLTGLVTTPTRPTPIPLKSPFAPSSLTPSIGFFTRPVAPSTTPWNIILIKNRTKQQFMYL